MPSLTVQTGCVFTGSLKRFKYLQIQHFLFRQKLLKLNSRHQGRQRNSTQILFWERGDNQCVVKAQSIFEFSTSIPKYIWVYLSLSEYIRLYPSDDDDLVFLLIAIPRASLHQGAGQGSGLRYGEAVNPLTFLVSNDHLDDDDNDDNYCGESSDMRKPSTLSPLSFE